MLLEISNGKDNPHFNSLITAREYIYKHINIIYNIIDLIKVLFSEGNKDNAHDRILFIFIIVYFYSNIFSFLMAGAKELSNRIGPLTMQLDNPVLTINICLA